MNKNVSVLKFNKYLIENINYKNNDKFEDKEEGVEVALDFDAKVDISEDKTGMVVMLSSDIFPDAENNNYPFEMNVAIKGYFNMENVFNENVDRYEANAIAILFPYLRALVSTISVNANVAPIIIPPMNINAYLEEKRLKV